MQDNKMHLLSQNAYIARKHVIGQMQMLKLQIKIVYKSVNWRKIAKELITRCFFNQS